MNMLADFENLKKPKKYNSDEKELKNELYATLDCAVKLLVSDSEKIAVAFSGGLDSSIIAYLVSKYSKPILFCVGFKDSHDVINARKSAKLLGFDLNTIYLEDLELNEYLEKTIGLVGTDNRLITDLNVPFFIILENLKKLGYDRLVLGQGADTLFGGFARYPYNYNKEFGEEIFFDIRNICKTNLQYNYKIGNYFGIKPLFPFLEKEVVELALKISPHLKIKNGVQKYILRETFRKYLPKEIVERKKKSFQYGSGIHKALKKISKNRFDKSSRCFEEII